MAERSGKNQFSPVDTAWLRMESPTNLTMVTTISTYDEPLDYERLKATIEHRFLRFKRFRQRVVESRLPGRRPYWEIDRCFDLNAHLHRVALPTPGDQTALQNLVSDLLSTPLDFSKPPWQIHYVENFNGGCALVFRLHHCLADGVALVHVFLSMTDTDPNAPWPVPEAAERHAAGAVERLTKALGKTIGTTETLVHEGMDALVHPSKAMEMAKLGGRGAKALGKLVLIPPDKYTIFRGKMGVTKRAAWSEPISLGDIKRIGCATGGTVNDILVSAAAGALRRYLEGRDEPVDGVNVRAIVPVNLRPLDAVPDMGNRFGLVFLSLPVGIEDPIDRLFEVKARMDAIKGSPEAVVAFGILGAIGITPIQIERLVVRIFGLKGTMVLTNVPGPRQPLYMAGKRMHDVMFWVPSPARLGMGISILSYAGEVRIGVQTDAGLVPDPQTIIANFHAEIDDLCDLTRAVEALQAVEEKSARAAQAAEPAEVEPEPAPPATAAPVVEPGVPTPPAEVPSVVSGLVEVPVEGGNGVGGDVVALELPAAPQVLAAAVDQTAVEPGHCQAMTRAGTPCKNRALPGSAFCRMHAG